MFRKMSQKIINFIKKNWKIIFVLLVLLVFIVVAQRIGLDKKITVIIVLILGYMTQLFTVLVGLIAAVPIIGPPIAAIISLPLIFIVNAIAYMVTFFSLRKGYAKDVLGSRVLVTTLLVGIIIGYALGKLL
jgi:hypothetical protein